MKKRIHICKEYQKFAYIYYKVRFMRHYMCFYALINEKSDVISEYTSFSVLSQSIYYLHITKSNKIKKSPLKMLHYNV